MEVTNSYAKTIYNLVDYLNKCRDSYYNKNESLITDKQYDELFDELQKLEEESGIVLSNSPTQSVGYPIADGIPTVRLDKPLLSLDKIKDSYEEVKKFCTHPVLLMHKLDGLTSMLTYTDGKLSKMCTRGNGIEGRDITHNACAISGIPKTIPYKGTIHIIGECIMTTQSWIRYVNKNKNSLDSNKEKSTPRNVASGSVSQKDSSVCADRDITFIAWNADDISTDGTMLSGLDNAEKIGFRTVYRFLEKEQLPENDYERIFSNMRGRALKDGIPIDGIVVMYNDIEYGKSLGRTEHHFKNGKAFKFYEEEYETKITDIEYTIGKTGVLTPTAVFEGVDIDGTWVTRASVHNISIMKKLNLCIGDKVSIYKANEIIPQIRRNETKHLNLEAYKKTIPSVCPYCNSKTEFVHNDDVTVLQCSNPDCSGKRLKLISFFVSKSALDIDGLSEKTIEKFIDMGFIKDYKDVFRIVDDHGADIVSMKGFGDKFLLNLKQSLEKSKNTTLDRLFVAMSIDEIGKATAKQLAEYFHNDPQEVISTFEERTYVPLSDMEGFGGVMSLAVNKWFQNEKNMSTFKEIVNILNINTVKEQKTSELNGLNFVITGSLHVYKNRQELVDYITSHGGNVQSGVTKDTTYLINNDSESSSSKNKKAHELGIQIITEEDFIGMYGTKQGTTGNTPDTTNQDKPVPKTGRKKLF